MLYLTSRRLAYICPLAKAIYSDLSAAIFPPPRTSLSYKLILLLHIAHRYEFSNKMGSKPLATDFLLAQQCSDILILSAIGDSTGPVRYCCLLYYTGEGGAFVVMQVPPPPSSFYIYNILRYIYQWLRFISDPRGIYTYFYNHAYRPRLEKLLYLEPSRSPNGFF